MGRPKKFSDEDILRVARDVFLEKGVHTSTQEVADSIGLSQAALFKRFGTKEELVMKALVPASDPYFIGMLDGGPDDRPMQEQLHSIGVVIGNFFSTMVPVMSAMHGSPHPARIMACWDGEPPPVRVTMALAKFLRQAHHKGLVSCAHPETVATMLLGSLFQRAFMLNLNKDLPFEPVETHVAQLVTQLWPGIAPLDSAKAG